MNEPLHRPENARADCDDEGAARRRQAAALAAVWQRLSPRLALSAARARSHVTLRAADMARVPVGRDGGLVRTAYQRNDEAARPGTPTRIRLVDLPPGARLELPIDAAADTACLVLAGQAEIGGVSCATHDYQQRGAGGSRLLLASARGARVMLREAVSVEREAGAGAAGICTARASGMPWVLLADGISRRLLAPPHGGAAAYLVRMAAGSAVAAHRHRHDEECLLIDGEMHLDDMLLFGGDFQLAHAGGMHHAASSERGALLCVHGDLELDCIGPGPRR